MLPLPVNGAEHYVYTTEAIIGDGAAGWAVGATVRSPLRFDESSMFVCCAISCLARFLTGSVSGDAGDVIGISAQAPAAGDWPDFPAQLQFQLSSSDRVMQNNPIDAFQVWGQQGGIRGHLTVPKLFGKSTNLSVTYTMLKASANVADRLNLSVALIGYKVYDPAALNLTNHPGAQVLDPSQRRV